MKKVKRRVYIRQYMKRYRKRHKKIISIANRVYYRKNRMLLISKAKKRQERSYHTPEGHLRLLYNSIKKWAKYWKLPITPWAEFKNWAASQTNYLALFKMWEKNRFDKQYAPVLIRGVKKRGFVLSNLEWSLKLKHTWWSSDKQMIEEICEKLEQLRAKTTGRKVLTKNEIRELQEREDKKNGVLTALEIRKRIEAIDNKKKREYALRNI